MKRFREDLKVITLNVGGTLFTTTKKTIETIDLTKFPCDRDENYFIDLDPEHFRPVLNWLRIDVYPDQFTDAFRRICEKLGIIDKLDLSRWRLIKLPFTLANAEFVKKFRDRRAVYVAYGDYYKFRLTKKSSWKNFLGFMEHALGDCYDFIITSEIYQNKNGQKIEDF